MTSLAILTQKIRAAPGKYTPKPYKLAYHTYIEKTF